MMEEKKAVLSDLLTLSYEEQKRYLSSMSEEAREAAGKVDDWSPKDVLAHVVHWDSMMANDIADPENKERDQHEDYNRTNARIWERYKETPWQEIEELIDQTYEKMAANLLELDEDDLIDPERFEWLNGRALWRAIAFTNFYHALQHIAVLYADQGNITYANKIQEQAADQQKRLSNADDWRGTVLYNLGCHYAVTGQKEAALDYIRAGFVIYPVLRNWAPDDPDLESLRNDPAFVALTSAD
jgi:hypothetical protein